MRPKTIGTSDTKRTYLKQCNLFAREKVPFEWFQRYSALRPIFQEHVRPYDKVLVIGCGNSSMLNVTINFNIKRNERKAV